MAAGRPPNQGANFGEGFLDGDSTDSQSSTEHHMVDKRVHPRHRTKLDLITDPFSPDNPLIH
jgi:hypothetical protein